MYYTNENFTFDEFLSMGRNEIFFILSLLNVTNNAQSMHLEFLKFLKMKYKIFNDAPSNTNAFLSK